MKKFYPNIKSVQLKVGIFTVIIILLFIFSYMWFTNRISTRTHQDLMVSFENVAGLEVGDKVMFRGMEVGRINSVEHKGDKVVVSSRIYSDIRLRKGTYFTIDNSSLMGGMALNIMPGAEEEWLDLKNMQIGESSGGIMGIVSQAGTALQGLEELLSKLKQDAGMIDKGEKLLDDASGAVKNVDETVDALGQEFSLTLKKLDQLSANIDALLAENSDSISKSIDSAPQAIAGLQSTLDSLQVLSAKVNQTMGKLNSSTGTAGRLMNDDELYGKVLESIQNIDALVQDIKKHPKKYVKFSIF